MNDDKSEIPSLKGLKILFFAMILILLGGVLFLFVMLQQRNQASTIHTQKPCIGEEIYIPVAKGMKIVDTHKEGNILTLVLQGASVQQIKIVNYCTAEILNTITLGSDNNTLLP